MDSGCTHTGIDEQLVKDKRNKIKLVDFSFEVFNVDCYVNHLSQWQMIAQVSKSQSGYDVGSLQENSTRSLCLIRVLYI